VDEKRAAVGLGPLAAPEDEAHGLA